MSWDMEATTTCPYEDAAEARRKGYTACGTCAVPDYACGKIDEREWAKRHCPKGCPDPDRWNHGCWNCEEMHDANGVVVPCKREEAGA